VKIKQSPEDFKVLEVADIFPEGKGEYSLYLLKKYDTSTWDALGKLAKKLRIPMDSIGFGGLKDKKAVAEQFVTIKNGPKKDIKEKSYELIYLGQTSKPMSKDLLLGNRFEVVVREFFVSEEAIKKEVELVKNFGIPNYFDEQRFGSVKFVKDFAIKEVIKGNYEKALYLMLAEASPTDIKRTRKFRKCLKKNWKNPKYCLKFASLNWEKRVIEFLSSHKPSKRTYKRALNLVDKEYLFFLGNAYQSYIWNEVLKKLLFKLGLASFSCRYILGELVFYKEVPQNVWDTLKELKIPLPSPKLNLEEKGLPDVLIESYEEVLKEEGFSELKELRTFIKGVILKTYPRPAVTFPKDLSWELIEKGVIRLKFFLEKGSYATLVVKRIYYGCQNS